MPLSLSGSGGITYPDGSVNTTRSVSTAGDTMSGQLSISANKPLRFAGSEFKYIECQAPHLAFYKTNLAGYHYYFRRNDTGIDGGANTIDLFTIENNGDARAAGQMVANGSIVSGNNMQAGQFIPTAFNNLGLYSHIDVTPNIVTLANTGFIDMVSFSGPVTINSHQQGIVAIYLCGAGQVTRLGADLVNIAVTFNVGINGYTIQNFTGGTVTLGIIKMRTRPGA
jgi:hypothetical protein